jgi:hypothetical protein
LAFIHLATPTKTAWTQKEYAVPIRGFFGINWANASLFTLTATGTNELASWYASWQQPHAFNHARPSPIHLAVLYTPSERQNRFEYLLAVNGASSLRFIGDATAPGSCRTAFVGRSSVWDQIASTP